jgi:hypothetical protein
MRDINVESLTPKKLPIILIHRQTQLVKHFFSIVGNLIEVPSIVDPQFL